MELQDLVRIYARPRGRHAEADLMPGQEMAHPRTQHRADGRPMACGEIVAKPLLRLRFLEEDACLEELFRRQMWRLYY